MGLINVDDLRTGMVLSEDLLGPHGRFLLPGGTVLEDRHLRVIKTWGVPEAPVDGVSRADAEAEAEAHLDPAVLARAREHADFMFQAADCSLEPMAEARRLAVAGLARRMADGWAPDTDAPDPDAMACETAPLPTADDLAREEQALSTFPDIYHRIMETLRAPTSSARHVASVVGTDASLSARLLRLVNSPFYGFPQRIETIDRAVAIVGMNEVSTLAMGLSVVRHFKNVPAAFLDMRAFWKHSIACGIFARLLAGNKVGLPEERHFVAGLLHDLGRLIIIKRLPQACARAMALSARRGVPLYRAEREILGYDHAKVGGLLFARWLFPASLVKAVRRHHAPSRESDGLDPAIIQLADILAHATGMGASGSVIVPPADQAAWQALDLPVGVMAACARQARRQMDDIVHSFLGEDD